MDEEKLLIEVYRESGEEARNNDTTRNTFLSFYVIALAAFVGLLAQRVILVDKLVWLLPAFFSLVGILNIVVLCKYTRRALHRQELITWGILSPHILRHLDIRAHTDSRRLGDWRWWCDHRIEVFFAVVYIIPLIFSLVFSFVGDPFGLTARDP